MMRALWWKAIGEAKIVFAAGAAVMFAFAWLFVWLSSMIELGPLGQLLKALPAPIERLSGIPFADITTAAGLISVLYVDPVILVTCAMWAVTRGSDAVSGELGRGTMEILLAQPVRRIHVLLTQGVVTTVGAFLLAGALWLGTWAGIATVHFDRSFTEPVDIKVFIPPAMNVFGLTFAMCGITTLISASDRYRARTVGLAGGVIVLEFIIKIVARMWKNGEFLNYATIFGAFEPQMMIKNPEEALAMSMDYNGVLFGLGFALYLAAGIVFCRRDLPAPL